MFHPRCGRHVILSNGYKTAIRTNATHEFNRGVVFSLEPIRDNELFEVQIDKKLNTWSGSVEIGVTVCNPDVIDIPVTASDLKGGTWIMLGQGILRDGKSLLEAYGCDLDQLVEGDKVGVLRTCKGELKFFVNGECQGVAATDIPLIVYAIVDMYGKCAQITVTGPLTPDSNTIEDDSNSELSSIREAVENESDLPNCLPNSALSNHVANISIANSIVASSNSIEERDEGVNDAAAAPIVAQEIESSNTDSLNIANAVHSTRLNNYAENNSDFSDKIKFHEKCGTLVRLTNNGRTAERRRPFDEFNNGVVMSSRALGENELFEIRIDRLVDKWSGSIEVGITTHDPEQLEFPATMTNLRSGTTMMSGTGILSNGKGIIREYGDFNLDELKEGDRIGMMMKSGNELCFYINGVEQGIAASNIPTPVWAVVDLYGMTVKVTIVDRDQREEQNLITRRNTNREELLLNGEGACSDESTREELLFHPSCGTYAEVINGGRVAFRPNAAEDFNNGVVLTNRMLKANELFEVRLDKCVTKWAGSLEIGVTTHSPTELEYPSTMTNVRSGTWMMTGNGVMHNGTSVVDNYGMNLDRLVVGDKVAVCRKKNGDLHFSVNGVDQGIAATNVPECVFGVIDLYGQAAQASIVSNNGQWEVGPFSHSNSAVSSDLRFHPLHGKNAIITKNGLCALRPNAHGEFNDAIVMSNRELHDGELFEVVIENMIERWSGSLEAGVTAIPPDEIDFPSTMTDIDYDTWMLSGSSVMRNGIIIMNNYKCDLDALKVGTRIGMMRKTDGSLHYFVNGEDQGIACSNVPSGIYAVIDLYGQCAQVSIMHSAMHLDYSLISVSPYLDASHLSMTPGLHSSIASEILHKFSKCCGSNIVFSDNQVIASRVRHFNHGLVFSANPLENDELFEVRLDKLKVGYSGCIAIGLTSLAVSDAYPSGSLPCSLRALDVADTWWINGAHIQKNETVLKLNFCPSFNRLVAGDRIGVKKTSDGTMRLYINGEDYGVAAYNISEKVFSVIDLYGSVESITIVSISRVSLSPHVETDKVPFVDSLESGDDGIKNDTSRKVQNTTKPQLVDNEKTLYFHENHGKNIQLSADRLSATRSESYNQGIVLSSRPLLQNQLFQVRIGTLNSCWSNSLAVGVTSLNPEKLHLPNSAFEFKRSTWVICGNSVFFGGVKIKGSYGPDLDSLSGGIGGHVIGIVIDEEARLHLFVNGVDQGIAAKEIPLNSYAIVDLYGQCQEVTLVSNNATELNDRTTQRGSLILGNLHSITQAVDDETRLQRVSNESVHQNIAKENLKESVEKKRRHFTIRAETNGGYFTSEGTRCYCETCHKIRGDEPLFTKGNPPKEYDQPFGWCRFALVTGLKENESWHMAYYGTRPGAVRRMLDKGELLFSGELGITANIINCKIKDEDSDGSQLVFSPSIQYTSVDHFAVPVEFNDHITGQVVQVRLVLQVAVEPGSYKVGPPSTPWLPSPPAESLPPPHNSLDTIEWRTKERGATQLLAIFIKGEFKQGKL